MEPSSASLSKEEKETYTRWLKLGYKSPHLHFVGKNTVAVHVGCHILFQNMDTSEEMIYHADSTVSGDGVQCVAGNSNVPVFAFVEKCFRPRMFVLMFPSFQRVCVINDFGEDGVLSLSFSEMEYLFALTSYPQFEVIVWTWRSGEKIASAQCGVRNLEQMIRCNLSTPVLLAQMCKTSTQFLLWELHVCSKKRLLKKYQHDIPNAQPPYCITWSPEGQLYIADSAGTAFMLDVEKQKVTECFIWGKPTTAILWFKNRLVLSSRHLVAYKRRSGGIWQQVWRKETDHPVERLATITGKDCFYGIDTRGHFCCFYLDEQGIISQDAEGDQTQQEEQESEETEDTTDHRGGFTDLCIIQPCGDHFAALRRDGTVMIWKVSTGELKASLEINKEVLTMTSHPLEPYVAVGTSDGTLEFLNVYTPERPLLLSQLYLIKAPVSLIYINNSGSYVVAASAQQGQVFVLKSDPGSKMDVLGFAHLKKQISQLATVEYKGNLVVLALTVTRQCCNAGDIVLFYVLFSDLKELAFVSAVHLPTPCNAVYNNPLKTGELYLAPHRSRQVQMAEVPVWVLYPEHIRQALKQAATFMMMTTVKPMEPWMTVATSISSGHQLRRFWMSVTEGHVLTYGADGMVFLRTQDASETLAVQMVHHRADLGVEKAMCTPLKDYIISLGHDGSLVCTNTGLPKNKAEEKQLRKLYDSLREKYLNRRATISVRARESALLLENKTCMEKWERMIAAREAAEFAEEKNRIYQDFRKVQAKISSLLDENTKKQPEQQLPISAFDLDIVGRKEKLEAAEEQREMMKKEMLARIAAQDNLCSTIKERFWETMHVKRKELKAIMATAHVENYALEKEAQELPENLPSAMLYRKLEKQLQEFDYFNPWEDSGEVMHKNLTSVSTMLFDQTRDLRKTIGQLDAEEEEEEKLEDKYHSFSGSSSHNFIECPSQLHYQLEINTHLQMYIETTLLKGVTYELRQFFNTLFDQLYSVKEVEVKNVIERNAKLRHIISELRIMVEKLKTHRRLPELVLDIDIEDPEWTQQEVPEDIIRVQDHEVDVTPYISPSEQALLDQQLAEEEARRLAELADDFRERALIVMMDGVLERRWEDEIKKDIPSPKVMKEKDPADFTLEDLQEIKKWEDEVDELMNEREKYRKILINDFGKVSQLLADGITKFNNQLAEVILSKLKVESAIGHEEIKMARARCRTLQRQAFSNRVKHISEAISNTEEENINILAEIQKLHSAASECRSTYEQLTNRDKNLDANFKKLFPECSPIVVDQLYKLFKRRPKMHYKSTLSVIMVNELSCCSVTSDKPSFLPAECLEFLKGLDTIDSSNNCPPNINEELWTNLCRIRRQKVECELKMRACALELAEAEQTVHLFQRRHFAGKEQLQLLQRQLTEANEEIVQFCLNAELQLVLKMGMIETPLSGKLSDFDDAVFISEAEIERVNQLIKAAGHTKLSMMRRAMKFHRKILCKEWLHKKMKMEIEDLEAVLYRVEKTKLTKQMMLYLKKKRLGVSDDKIIDAVDRERAIMQEEFEKTIAELQQQMSELDERIAEKVKVNKHLDVKITALNINVSEQQMLRDLDMETRQADAVRNRMACIMKRSRIINKIQTQHAEMLQLHTQLELARLRTYPTLKHKPPL